MAHRINKDSGSLLSLAITLDVKPQKCVIVNQLLFQEHYLLPASYTSVANIKVLKDLIFV